MNQANPKILFVGLPSSGKTTFIAALWHFLSKANDENSLSLVSLEGDNSYLNEIANSWLAFEKVGRTSKANDKLIAMNVKSNITNSSGVLNIPDFSGEVFLRDHLESREWTQEYDQMLSECGGIVLFVNPAEEKNRPQFVLLANEILGFFGDEPDSKPVETIEWSPDFVPHQVKLVELLQFMEFSGRTRKPIKISIVVSAWDLIEHNMQNAGTSPVMWFGKSLPLLFQYLESNSEIFTARYYGVSAQGGDYEGTNINELTRKKPLERILVRDEHGYSGDITKPLIWLLE